MRSDWGMSRAMRLEQFSRAYLRAIAAVAGLAIYEPEVDDDSIDLGLAARGGRGTLRSPRLEIQIKATGRDLLGEKGIPLPLKVKNFDDLRGKDFIVPRILTVLLVPPDIEEWLQQSDEEMALRRCAYWLSLREHPPRKAESSVTVLVPRTNRLTVESIHEMMERVSRGEWP